RGMSTISGHVSQSKLHPRRNRRSRDVMSVQRHDAAATRKEAGQGFDQLELSVAVHPRYAQNFAASYLEAQRTEPRRGKIPYGESRRSGRLRGAGVARLRNVAADHHLGQLPATGAGYWRPACDSPGAKHDDIVANVEGLGQLVADEHNSFVFVAQPAKDRQQIADFRGREIRG